ncbi:unnamed protein product [Closterium sp. Naga37s-1]|nr:unnamed protein product [Closterium sp. Naga37s-1]
MVLRKLAQAMREWPRLRDCEVEWGRRRRRRVGKGEEGKWGKGEMGKRGSGRRGNGEAVRSGGQRTLRSPTPILFASPSTLSLSPTTLPLHHAFSLPPLSPVSYTLTPPCPIPSPRPVLSPHPALSYPLTPPGPIPSPRPVLSPHPALSQASTKKTQTSCMDVPPSLAPAFSISVAQTSHTTFCRSRRVSRITAPSTTPMTESTHTSPCACSSDTTHACGCPHVHKRGGVEVLGIGGEERGVGETEDLVEGLFCAIPSSLPSLHYFTALLRPSLPFCALPASLPSLHYSPALLRPSLLSSTPCLSLLTCTPHPLPSLLFEFPPFPPVTSAIPAGLSEGVGHNV